MVFLFRYFGETEQGSGSLRLLIKFGDNNSDGF